MTNINTLSFKITKSIDQWQHQFPKEEKKSALIQSLMIVQKENNGFLTKDIINKVAKYFDIPTTYVYEIATFYSMYELKPAGRYKICVCTNLSCMINGSSKIINYLFNKLNIKSDNLSVDGKFYIKEVECLAACDGAPMMQINDECYKNLTTKKIDNILSNLLKKI